MRTRLMFIAVWFATALLAQSCAGNDRRPMLENVPSVVLFAGDGKTAYRDPAILYHGGSFHLYFTLVETEPDGLIYSYVAYSKSKDLVAWSEIRKITEKNQSLNYSSPGNVIRFGDEWWLCFQTYPRPAYAAGQPIRFGDEAARLYVMRSTDLDAWSAPELIRVKGDHVSPEDMGRMIDPYIFEDKGQPGKYWCVFKQNGISLSHSEDLRSWTFFGNIQAGENPCLILDDDKYVLFHSPHNGIGIKSSTDLTAWQDWGNPIMLGQEHWDWAKGRITAGAVADLRNEADVGKFVMFFHGSGPLSEMEGDFDRNSSIGIAWSDDLRTWEWPGKGK